MKLFRRNKSTEAGASPRKSSAGRKAALAALATLGVLVLAVITVVAILLVNANILREPIARYVSNTLNRPFAINGDLEIDLFRHPRVVVNAVTLGNAQWGSRPTMAQLDRADVSFRLMPLFRGQLVLPQVQLVKPDILLERNKEGQANWEFERDQQTAKDDAGNQPEIHSLWIETGKVAFIDPEAKTDVALTLTSERGQDARQSRLSFAGTGSLRDEEFKLEGHADSLLELTEAGQPYKLDVKARAGATKAAFAGTIVPMKIESIDGEIDLSGKDLSKLYPIVPVPLPWTPAYNLSGHLVRNGQTYSVRSLKGKVGSSDISGKADVDIGSKRPVITADITSQKLDYKDLAGLLGAPPPEKGKARTPEQKKAVEKIERTGKVLPSKPYNLTALRSVDADVKFKGKSILYPDIPLDNVAFHLKLEQGRLALAPLDFGVAGGKVISRINMDASQDIIQTRADATARNLELKRLMPAAKEGPGSAGKVGGRIKLATKGNSIAQMLASGNGELGLIMSEGRASTLILVLTNLDLANATRYILKGNPNAPINCAVITATLKEGAMTPDIFVIDSSEERITGEGNIDFRDEEYDLRIVADSKRVSLAALRGPIEIGGTFKDPSIRPEAGPLAARVGAAVALGALLTPVAALLPLIDPGNAEDTNCGGLVNKAKKDVATKRVEAPKKVAPAEVAEQPTGDRKRGTQ